MNAPLRSRPLASGFYMQELGTNCCSAQLEHDLSFSPVSPFDGQPWRAERAKLGLHGTLSALLPVRARSTIPRLARTDRQWRPRTSSSNSQSLDPCTPIRRSALPTRFFNRQTASALRWRDKSSGRRWGSLAHLAGFFVLAQMRGRTLDARVGSCPSLKSSNLAIVLIER